MKSKKKFVGFRCIAVRAATKQISEFSYYHITHNDFFITMTKDNKNDISKKEIVSVMLKYCIGKC